MVYNAVQGYGPYSIRVSERGDTGDHTRCTRRIDDDKPTTMLRLGLAMAVRSFRITNCTIQGIDILRRSTRWSVVSVLRAFLRDRRAIKGDQSSPSQRHQRETIGSDKLS